MDITRETDQFCSNNDELNASVAGKFVNEALADAELRQLDSTVSEQTAEEKKQINTFQELFAVDVQLKDKKYEYKISVHGEDKILFSTDATAAGLEQAEKQVSKLVVEKQAELEKIFEVEFSKAGDDVTRQWIERLDCVTVRGAMIKARSPQLFELYAIEAALYHAQPSQAKSANGQSIKFQFLQDNYYSQTIPALAYFTVNDKDGRPSIYYEPGKNKDIPATEADSERANHHRQASVEAVTLHELSHAHQHRMGWDSSSVKMQELAKEFGWLPFRDTTTNQLAFLFKGKQGEFYRYGKDHCKDKSVWVKSNKSGQPLDASGRVAGSYKSAKQYTKQEITDLAEVMPPTWYFINPKEMFAEGLKLYRLNEANRAELLTESPKLYAAVKKQDELESIKEYGKLADGTPKHIRGVDGKWVESTDESRKAVADFEAKVKADNKKTTAIFRPAIGKLAYAR